MKKVNHTVGFFFFGFPVHVCKGYAYMILLSIKCKIASCLKKKMYKDFPGGPEASNAGD